MKLYLKKQAVDTAKRFLANSDIIDIWIVEGLLEYIQALEEHIEDLQEQIEDDHQDAYNDGYHQGYVDGQWDSND